MTAYPPPPGVSDRVRPAAHTAGLAVGVVLVAVAATVAAVTFGLVAFGFVVWWKLGPDIGDAAAAAGRYLDRVEAGDDAGAYRLLCDTARGQVTPQAFTSMVGEAGRPAAYVLGNRFFADEAGHYARVDAELTDRSGVTRTLELTVVLSDEWRVCGDTLI